MSGEVKTEEIQNWGKNILDRTSEGPKVKVGLEELRTAVAGAERRVGVTVRAEICPTYGWHYIYIYLLNEGTYSPQLPLLLLTCFLIFSPVFFKKGRALNWRQDIGLSCE